MFFSSLIESFFSADLLVITLSILAASSIICISIYCIRQGVLFSNQEDPIDQNPSLISPYQKFCVDDGRF
ncbi:hypothetical protein [Legionella worsleiensis]|uniref:Uncharacterized protein n=1 Tax=Legionella worsleiensis TaxID=45076 RepID=A0A0W1AKA2_9GAMM|nr:hypothetical protein [Legionella worsleiensis]KTD81603.1 hypothetical protein Lwor_0385 [Legionella worsleiensis]STY31988.1 Uncharacterised protein [Legionella worsleiensis]